MGVELSWSQEKAFISMDFDFNNYELYTLYTVERKNEGSLCISDEVVWQNDYACNDTINIFTGEEY